MTHLLQQTLKATQHSAAALAIGAAGLFTAAAPGDVVLYQHTFDGESTSNLGGTAVDTATGTAGGTAGAQWNSGGNYWKADGTVASEATSDNATTAAGLLPFAPQTGWIYTLSLTVEAKSGSDWLWAGFGNASLTSSGSTNRVTSQGLGVYALGVNAGVGQSFVGPGTGNSLASHNEPDYTAPDFGPVLIEIVLDTRTDDDNWSLEWFRDGNSIRGPLALNGTTVNGEAIAQVGFGRFRRAGGEVSQFSLTAVPEPASLMLLGAGAGAMLLRRQGA